MSIFEHIEHMSWIVRKTPKIVSMAGKRFSSLLSCLLGADFAHYESVIVEFDPQR